MSQADDLKTSQETLYIQKNVDFLITIYKRNKKELSKKDVIEMEEAFGSDLYRYKRALIDEGKKLDSISVNSSQKAINYTFFNQLSDFYIVDRDVAIVEYYIDDLCDIYEEMHKNNCASRREMFYYSLINRILKVKMDLNINDNVSLSELNYAYDFEPSLGGVLLRLSKTIIWVKIM